MAPLWSIRAGAAPVRVFSASGKASGIRVGSAHALITLPSGQVLWRLLKPSVFPSALLGPCIDLDALVLRVPLCLLYSWGVVTLLG